MREHCSPAYNEVPNYSGDVLFGLCGVVSTRWHEIPGMKIGYSGDITREGTGLFEKQLYRNALKQDAFRRTGVCAGCR